MKLRTENIQKSYKGRKVVKGVSFEVNQGEIVGLLGPNGAGKTTSFYMIVGLVKPDEGQVFLEGKTITTTPMYRRAQMGIGYLPQEISVFRKLSVEDNIKAVLEMTKLSKAEQRDKAESLLEEFSLTHVRKNLGQQLSGGEKRRTEIARALATDPNFILLDEPFAGVDPIAVEDIQSIVHDLKHRNIGILITDHNVQETLSITDRAYLLFEGRILKSGTAEELAADEQVRKVYLGQNFELRKKNISGVLKKNPENSDTSSNNSRYLRGLIKRAERIPEQISGWNYLFLIPNIATYHEVDLLKKDIEEAKLHFEEYFEKNYAKSPSILSQIKLDKMKRYQLGIGRWLGLEYLAPIVPFVGWFVLYVYIKRLNRLKSDLKLLASHLTTLQNYAENPELLNMDSNTNE